MSSWFSKKMGMDKVTAKLENGENLDSDDIDKVLWTIRVFKLHENNNPSFFRQLVLGWRILWIK